LPTFFLFIPILKLRKKRICWTLHDVDIYKTASGITGNLQLLFLNIVSQPGIMTKYCDRILVHAFSLREHLITKGVDKNKVCVIPHFDYRFLLETQLKNQNRKSDTVHTLENYVLFFGSIAPWKGIDTLVEAAKIVRKKIGEKFNLVIAGTPYEGYRKVHFFGNIINQDLRYITIIDKYISTPEIPSLITNSSFLVLPYHDSSKYSVSGVIPLAYTFAKPVVVSKVSSLTEYVEHNKTGLIFNTDNSKELADCIIQLVENNIKCLELGKNAYKKLTTQMSLEVCSAQIDNIYNQLRT
jgi:glycosyltransferase involved in cell wall biosynthesis